MAGFDSTISEITIPFEHVKNQVFLGSPMESRHGQSVRKCLLLDKMVCADSAP